MGLLGKIVVAAGVNAVGKKTEKRREKLRDELKNDDSNLPSKLVVKELRYAHKKTFEAFDEGGSLLYRAKQGGLFEKHILYVTNASGKEVGAVSGGSRGYYVSIGDDWEEYVSRDRSWRSLKDSWTTSLYKLSGLDWIIEQGLWEVGAVNSRWRAYEDREEEPVMAITSSSSLGIGSLARTYLEASTLGLADARTEDDKFGTHYYVSYEDPSHRLLGMMLALALDNVLDTIEDD